MKFLLVFVLASLSLSAFAFEVSPDKIYKKGNTIFVEYQNVEDSSIECKVYYHIKTTLRDFIDNTYAQYLFSGDDVTTKIQIDPHEEGHILSYLVSVRCRYMPLY